MSCLRTLSLIILTTLSLAILTPKEGRAQEDKQEVTADLGCDTTLTGEDLKNSSVLTVIGVRCFEVKKYLLALKYYREAYKLSKSPFLLGAIGRSFEELKYYSLASSYYKQFLRRAFDTDRRITKRLSKMKKLLREEGIKFSLDSQPSGANVYLVINKRHREPLGKTPLNIELIQGEYQLVVEKNGYQTREASVDIPGDINSSSKELLFRLYPNASMSLRTPNDQWADLAILTYIFSTPVVIAGGTMIGIGYDKSNDAKYSYNAQRNTQIKTASTIKTIGYSLLGLGVAGFLTATTFQILSLDFSSTTTKTKQNSKRRASLDVSPLGIQVSGAF